VKPEFPSRIKTISIEKTEAWLSKRFAIRERAEIILYVSIAAYATVFSILTIFQHYEFRTYAWDLGIFTQSLWTTLNGKGFLYHTCEIFMNPSGSFFGVHFSPILFSVLPIYWIFPEAETLLTLQSFVLALAAIPIYKLAKEYAGGRIVGLVFALGYLLFPAVHYVNLYDFHVQSFLPLFFSFTVYFIVKEDWPNYFLFMFLALMVEEHAAAIVFFEGVFVTWRYKSEIFSWIKTRKAFRLRLLIPAAVMVTSVVWYLFTIWQRNTFFPTNPATAGQFMGSGNFRILGAEDPLDVPILVILRPLEAAQSLVFDAQIKLVYIIVLFGPLAFFSFKSLSVLIPTLPWLGFSFFSMAECHHMLGRQYETYLVSFIFAAAILALSKDYLKKPTLGSVKRSIKIIMVSILISFIVLSPLSPVPNILFPNHKPICLGGTQTSVYIGEHERSLACVANMIPSNASVMTQDNLFPHVSDRADAYVVAERFLITDICDIVVDFINQTLDKVQYVFMDSRTDSVASMLLLSLLTTKPQFTLVASADNGTILLYERVE
jgi:uncharacterized membrane protein